MHPDDALAEKRHGTNGKTEMWYVVSADPGAHLLVGLKDSIGQGETVLIPASADDLCLVPDAANLKALLSWVSTL